ncbi:DUF5688 family protein [Eubacterium oxidoreducens]|uniref:Uncharacterized protein n=1 Tax=Eubacterium oxidoreducens TaxID=1732 RepID=A0A1G6B2Y5_EUBOX|nr:DUF5688 family protein [Eubacterium oxidoreducens]SDB14813.1 hypothetical protein SAMN02910417_01081 [Eubacterium oxidoreducens]
MLDTNTLDKIAETVHSDLYILPSSIHEVICVSTELTDDLDFLMGMVRTVNGTEVREEEQLSDSVYRYDASNKCVKRCTY